MGTIVGRDGPLVDQFRVLGPVLLLEKGGPGRLTRLLERFIPLRLWKRARAIQRFASEGGYRLIYSNTITNGAILALLSEFGLPVLTHVHEMDYWIWRGGAENLRQVKLATKRYIAVSEAVRETLVARHGIDSDSITVVHEFLEDIPAAPVPEDRRRARERLNLPAHALVIGASGAEYWRKGRDLIVPLLMALQLRGPAPRPVHFVWVGRPGTAEEEYALSHDLRRAGFPASYHATGEVPDPYSFYPAFDLFVLLSRDDPFPLVCLEAAAMQLPILCFQGAGGMPEFVEEDCGLSVSYLDVSAMAQAIERVCLDPQFSRKLGEVGRQKVMRNHTVEAAAPAIIRQIQDIVNEDAYARREPLASLAG